MVADLDREIADDPCSVDKGVLTQHDLAERADVEHRAQIR